LNNRVFDISCDAPPLGGASIIFELSKFDAFGKPPELEWHQNLSNFIILMLLASHRC